MRPLITIVVFFFVVANMLSSCKKNKSNDNGDAKTKTELLTTGPWKYASCVVGPAYDYYGNGNPVTDIYSIMLPCEKDDFEVYKTNGIWEYNEGPTKCDPANPQIVYMEPWSFTSNETKVIVGGVECIILELTETTLKLRYTFEDGAISYTEEDSYRH